MVLGAWNWLFGTNCPASTTWLIALRSIELAKAWRTSGLENTCERGPWATFSEMLSYASAVADRSRRLGSAFTWGASVGASRSAISELARLQIDQPYRRVGDGLIDDAVELDGAGVPVTGKALHHDFVLRDALDQLERPGAGKLTGDVVVAQPSHGLRCHHHAGAVCEHGHQRHIGLAQVQQQRMWIRDLHAADRPEFRFPQT